MVPKKPQSGRLARKLSQIHLFSNTGKRADFLLLFVVFILSIFGLIMVYDASIVEANESFGDKFHYLKYQGFYFILGWIGLLITGRIDYHIYKRIIKWLFIGNLILLVAVLIPHVGLSIKGARRWIDLGFTTFQPAETFKPILIMYLATWLEKKRTVIQFFALIGFILGLLILQPDMGTSIVLVASTFTVYFVSGAPVAKFSLATLTTLLIGLMLIFSSPYRKDRLITFLNHQSDPLGNSYHIQQILISLGSGGVTGVGIGQSMQKYQYLPEATTDSIFAIVGEETGFIGTTILIACFLAIIWKGFQIAQKAPDMSGRLIAAGITTWLGTQTFVNLSSMVSLTPLTGIPLPFMSYGGTALIVALVSVGVLLNISKQIVEVRK